MAVVATGTIVHIYPQTRVRDVRFSREKSTKVKRVFHITTADGKTGLYGVRVPKHGDDVMVDSLFLEMGRTLTPTKDLKESTDVLSDVLRSIREHGGLSQLQHTMLSEISLTITDSYHSWRDAADMGLDVFKVAAQPGLRSEKLGHIRAANRLFNIAAGRLEEFTTITQPATMDSDLRNIARAAQRFDMWTKAFDLELFI